jgi:hypothetical protein
MPELSSDGFNLVDAQHTAKEYKNRAGFCDTEKTKKELAALLEEPKERTKIKRRRIY